MSQSKTQETAAAKAVVAGMSVRAARKWQNGTLLSETKEERTRRTRGGATGHELVRRGRGVFYAATYQVLQDLLAAKRDLALPRELRRYDAFDLVVLDDLGYVQRSVDEAEVLFMDAGEARLSAAVVQRAVRAEFLKLGSLVHANGWSEEPSELDFEEGEARWAR